MKRFKIYFKNSDQSAIVTAHHFVVSVDGTVDFFKDDKEKDREIFVRLEAVAAITAVEPASPPRTSTSTRTLR